MSKRSESDEHYIINLCDRVTGMIAERQKRFGFLKGDPGKHGRCALLPIDAFYPLLNLAVEYREVQHSKAVPHMDKKLTCSGVPRGEQRKLYDERRRSELGRQEIQLLELDYHLFSHNSRDRLHRKEAQDLEIVREHILRFPSHVTA